ncbi:MAG TPA: hypothetical protein VE780_11305, partial [Thermoleophilaceae bacterium]|nr:hypothetical protein [Thermoleophilaceae bacterium]
VGEVVSETFSLYGRNAGPLLGSAIVVFVIVGPLSALVENSGGVLVALLAAIIRLAGFALYAGFVVRLVQDARDGRRDLTLGDLLSSAAPAILPLIVFGILFAIGVAIGLALLIIPGLILLTFWSVGAPAIVVERAGPIAAFGRSWRLVRGDAWSVFATLVVVLLIVIAIGIGLAIIATPISNGATVAASIISNVITAPIFSVAVSVTYFELGGARAAVGTPAPPIEPPPPSAPAV